MEKLTNEELDNVSGGMIFYSKNVVGANPDKPWETIDIDGNVIGQFEKKEDAINKAKEYGSNPLNTLEINWDQLCYLRNR